MPTNTRADTRRAGRRPRGRPREGAIDAAILDATEQLLGARGYEAMTVEQVAAAAGVSKPTIYLRYRSKRELAAATIDRLRPPLPVPSGRSARGDLVALVEIERQWVDRHGLGIVAAVLLEQSEHPELLERFKRRVVEPVRAAFREVLEAGIARGELRRAAGSPEVIDALTGAYWARSWATDGPTTRWPERVVDVVLRGLAADAADAPDPGDVNRAAAAPTARRPARGGRRA
jgi:AcrR family transcriptional regulator